MQLKVKKYNAIILNYANPDMVGHTGNLEAAITAIEYIDKCVEKSGKSNSKCRWSVNNYC